MDWLYKYKGNEFIDLLRIRANSVYKPFKHEKEELLKQMLNEIKNYD